MLKLLTLYILLSLHQTTTINEYKTLQAWLYILLSLHQTTTIMLHCLHYSVLYILLSLHQTTTIVKYLVDRKKLYILLSLHQATTNEPTNGMDESCIFFYLYIKPQPTDPFIDLDQVVYSSIFTSNHNASSDNKNYYVLYILLSLHQTTTVVWYSSACVELYILLSLHQTTTL